MLALPVATYYHARKRLHKVRPADSIIEETCLKNPFYGYRRIYAELKENGFSIGKNQIRKSMKRLGFQPKPWRPKVRYKPGAKELNLIAGRTVKSAGEILASDASWIPMGKRRGLYLAITLDLYTRQVLGFALSNRLDTKLVLIALAGAIATKAPQKEWIHHSDQGCTYTATHFKSCLAATGAKASYSDPGKPQQNGKVESFFKTLKTEELKANEYESPHLLVLAITNFIENYNQNRRHSALGYIPPNQFAESTKGGYQS